MFNSKRDVCMRRRTDFCVKHKAQGTSELRKSLKAHSTRRRNRPFHSIKMIDWIISFYFFFHTYRSWSGDHFLSFILRSSRSSSSWAGAHTKRKKLKKKKKEKIHSHSNNIWLHFVTCVVRAMRAKTKLKSI
jgi:hypothetical protein